VRFGGGRGASVGGGGNDDAVWMRCERRGAAPRRVNDRNNDQRAGQPVDSRRGEQLTNGAVLVVVTGMIPARIAVAVPMRCADLTRSRDARLPSPFMHEAPGPAKAYGEEHDEAERAFGHVPR
jgi:hypothetical protein